MTLSSEAPVEALSYAEPDSESTIKHIREMHANPEILANLIAFFGSTHDNALQRELMAPYLVDTSLDFAWVENEDDRNALIDQFSGSSFLDHIFNPKIKEWNPSFIEVETMVGLGAGTLVTWAESRKRNPDTLEPEGEHQRNSGLITYQELAFSLSNGLYRGQKIIFIEQKGFIDSLDQDSALRRKYITLLKSLKELKLIYPSQILIIREEETSSPQEMFEQIAIEMKNSFERVAFNNYIQANLTEDGNENAELKEKSEVFENLKAERLLAIAQGDSIPTFTQLGSGGADSAINQEVFDKDDTRTDRLFEYGRFSGIFNNLNNSEAWNNLPPGNFPENVGLLYDMDRKFEEEADCLVSHIHSLSSSFTASLNVHLSLERAIRSGRTMIVLVEDLNFGEYLSGEIVETLKEISRDSSFSTKESRFRELAFRFGIEDIEEQELKELMALSQEIIRGRITEPRALSKTIFERTTKFQEAKLIISDRTALKEQLDKNSKTHPGLIVVTHSIEEYHEVIQQRIDMYEILPLLSNDHIIKENVFSILNGTATNTPIPFTQQVDGNVLAPTNFQWTKTPSIGIAGQFFQNKVIPAIEARFIEPIKRLQKIDSKWLPPEVLKEITQSLLTQLQKIFKSLSKQTSEEAQATPTKDRKTQRYTFLAGFADILGDGYNSELNGISYTGMGEWLEEVERGLMREIIK